VVIRDRRLVTMDQDALFAEIMQVVPQFQKDFAEIRARIARLKPSLDEAHRRIWAEDVGGDRLFVEPIGWG